MPGWDPLRGGIARAAIPWPLPSSPAHELRPGHHLSGSAGPEGVHSGGHVWTWDNRAPSQAGSSARPDTSVPLQALRPEPGRTPGAMALRPEPAGGRRVVIINVGGCRVRLAWAALARCPLARLERLRACRGRDEVLRVCDDYDAGRDEFFFDRSPCAFRAIVALLRAGKLRLLRGPCALAFRDELAYWGIDEARLERCCLRRLRRREEEAAEARAEPPGSPGGAGPGRRLRDLLDDPRSGPAGKLFACVSVAFVAATAVGLCLSTMPDIRAEEERVSVGGPDGLGVATGGGVGCGWGWSWGGGQTGAGRGRRSWAWQGPGEGLLVPGWVGCGQGRGWGQRGPGGS